VPGRWILVASEAVPTIRPDAVQQSVMESFLTSAGYGALIIFGFVEACCIPISSEVTFGFAGVLAYEGHLSLVLVIIIGTLAELAGSLTSYAVGRRGGRRTVERLGRYVLITRKDIDRAEGFFNGRGAWVVAVGRAMPLVRAFTSIVAGLVEVPAVQFVFLSLLGTVVWATTLSVIGYELGSAWHSVAGYFSLGGYVIAALVVLGLAGLAVYRLREVRKDVADRQPEGPVV
jgi:membrane protein DedA with SNARE-associated domain